MKVGAAQIDIITGDAKANRRKCIDLLRHSAAQNLDVLVFPECTLPGYSYSSAEDALENAETIPGKSITAIEDVCSRLNISTVVGLLEKDGDRLYNTTVLVSPKGIIGTYRKTHTLVLGVDRFVTPGNDFGVWSLSEVPVGMLICYDQRFPEPARILGLKGAHIIFCSANLPEGAEAYPDFLNQSRACENRLFIVHANRVGIEGSVQYIGRSQIIDFAGRILAQAGSNNEEIITADIDPTRAAGKHIVMIPGEYEFDVRKDRRIDLYGPIVGPMK